MTYEAFQASFTGQMSTCRLGNGKVYTFHNPLPRVVKGRHYIIAYEPRTGKCRILVVVAPGEERYEEPIPE